MRKTVVHANRLSKKYSIDSESQYDTLRDSIVNISKKFSRRPVVKKKRNSFWALKDISFKVEQGEVLGIIGRNGAGKSTLLKILSRIVAPTSGNASIHGNVSSILEVGTGFHPELTGRENVYLNGAIIGMRKKEIDRKFKQIVEFSEVGRFLDMPVKRYSSGMQVRLAFAVASHLDSDVLLIDEVLAVGDASFRKKSLLKMQSIAKDEGRTVVYVSHSMPSVEALCSRTILLDKGHLAASGPTREVISKYVALDEAKNKTELSENKFRTGNGKLKITDFWIEDENKKKINLLHSGGSYVFVFAYEAPDGKSQKDIDLGFALSTEMEQPLILNLLSYTTKMASSKTEGELRFKFNKFPLASGSYKLTFRLVVQGKEADHLVSGIPIKVESGDFYKTGALIDQTHSPILIEGLWEIK